MGCTVREKHIKTSRRAKSVKPSTSESMLESGLKPWTCEMGCDGNCEISNKIKLDNINDDGNNNNNNDDDDDTNDDALNPGFDDCGWGYCTEEQLEEILLKHLEFLYDKAVSKLIELGYDEEVALKAVLRNGHCYGGMDVLTNILHNSLTYLRCSGNDGNEDESKLVFTELRQLEEYSLAGMVCLLQQVHPHLSRGDAMWCLLMSDLHLGRASTIDFPMLPSPSNVPRDATTNIKSVNTRIIVPPGLCKFHGGWGFRNGGNSDASIEREIDWAKRLNLSPSMKSLLKKNVAAITAGFRSKQQQKQAPLTNEACQESHGNNEDVNSLLNKFCDLNLDENLEGVTEDQKDEIVLTLLNQVKDLDKQLNERKDWAQEKAMQAARKLSSDLTELNELRTEREQAERLKDLKLVFEDRYMKRLSEMENALRKASSQVDCANAAVKQLEIENAEIRAEMEASKLSASESLTTCLEAAKKEKKCLKRLLAWEKQKTKLQDEIAGEKQKISSLQQQLVQINAAQKEAEAKWRQEVKDKELAMALVEEERRSKETTEVNNKRNLEALRLRIEIDFQRHKDDLQRLEPELSRLKASSQFSEPNNPSDTFPTGSPKHQGPSITRLLRELDEPKREGSERACMICMKDDVSIVFLPCAHQVMCVGCGEDYGKNGKATCPCCRVPIEKRIRVFGASS